MLFGTEEFQLIYCRSGVSQKEGKNKDRAFYLLGFVPSMSGEYGQEPRKVFVWADDLAKAGVTNLQLGNYYECLFDSSNGDRLVMIDNH